MRWYMPKADPAKPVLVGLRTTRGRMLCQVQLDHGSGRIMQTGGDQHHSTWWPLADYLILANCALVTT